MLYVDIVHVGLRLLFGFYRDIHARHAAIIQFIGPAKEGKLALTNRI